MIRRAWGSDNRPYAGAGERQSESLRGGHRLSRQRCGRRRAGIRYLDAFPRWNCGGLRPSGCRRSPALRQTQPPVRERRVGARPRSPPPESPHARRRILQRLRLDSRRQRCAGCARSQFRALPHDGGREQGGRSGFAQEDIRRSALLLVEAVAAGRVRAEVRCLSIAPARDLFRLLWTDFPIDPH